jgi:hypothetical protein
MKHEVEFPVEHLRQRDLPDAPMAIQRQVLERPLHWGGMFRWFAFVRLRRE